MITLPSSHIHKSSDEPASYIHRPSDDPASYIHRPSDEPASWAHGAGTVAGSLTLLRYRDMGHGELSPGLMVG